MTNRIRFLACLLLLLPSPALAQDDRWLAGAAIGLTLEREAPIYNRVLVGALGGSATAVSGSVGRRVAERLRVIGELATAREFSDDARVVSSPEEPIELVRAHRDAMLTGLLQFGAAPRLWLSAGVSLVNARVREEGTATRRFFENGALRFTKIPYGPQIDSRWEAALTVGVDYQIPVSDRFRIVPAVRYFPFDHDPGTSVPTYGLAAYMFRTAVGGEFSF